MSPILRRRWSHRPSGLFVPSDEPAFTGASNQTVLLDTDLTGPDYADAASMGANPYSVGDVSGPLRIIPNVSPIIAGAAVNTARNEVVTDTDGTKWLRGHWFGEGNGSTNWETYPLLQNTNANGLWTYGLTYMQRWNFPNGTPQVKNIEVWGSTAYLDDNGRLQVSTLADGRYVVHDMVFTTDTSQLRSPFDASITDIADGRGYPISMRWRWHDRSPGTVDRLISVVNPLPFTTDTFVNSQAGVLYNTARVRLNNIYGTGYASEAEFIVSNFDGDKRATLTRAPDILGGAITYSGATWFLAPVEYAGAFSVSQVGQINSGDILAMNNTESNSIVPCIATAFNGTTGCKLPQYNPGEVSLPIRDWFGLWFSRPSDQTGFVEYWVNHVKVIHIARSLIGNTPVGGLRPWATTESIATLGVGAALSKVRWGNVQANTSGAWWMDAGNRITIWKQP